MPPVKDDPALARLAELIPPPADVEPIDWAVVEDDLGTPLPPDFKAFCDRWGSGAIYLEGPVDIHPEIGQIRWWLDTLADFMEDGIVPRAPLFPDDGGLLPFGSTESRWELLWRTGGDPSTWTVVVLSDEDPAAGAIVRETGLVFVAWLVAALEGTLPDEVVPPELQVEPDAPPLGALGHRWYPGGHGDDDAEDQDELDLEQRPTSVVSGLGGDEQGAYVTLDLGGVLERDRQAALDGFLLYVATEDAALAAEVEEAKARRSAEVVRLRSSNAVGGIARAAAAFAASELGIEHYDDEWLDGLLDDEEEWPPG